MINLLEQTNVHKIFDSHNLLLEAFGSAANELSENPDLKDYLNISDHMHHNNVEIVVKDFDKDEIFYREADRKEWSAAMQAICKFVKENNKPTRLFALGAATDYIEGLVKEFKEANIFQNNNQSFVLVCTENLTV